MKITIIGTGNLGTVLSKILQKAGHSITVLPGRSVQIKIDNDVELVIVAIADDALYRLHERLKLTDQLIVHTAGSVSKDVLRNISINYGVLYPLQSIRKEMETYPDIPFLVDANTKENRSTLHYFATAITGRASYADDQQRLKLHLAAVIANNFSNHLFALTADYCKQENIDFAMLQPLLQETVNRLKHNSAKNVQTGPAARKDTNTLQKHRDMLRAYPRLSELYNVFTASIINYRS